MLCAKLVGKSGRLIAGPLGKIAYTGKDMEIAINSHKSLLFQHKTKPLTYDVSGDNNFVKTLSNFHSSVTLKGGMRRKRRDPQTKRRERDLSDVDCPTQQKTYCNTYHKIDKGNGAEAKYDISTESHLHGWPPKLAAARYFNMNSNNAYKVYVCLHNKHHLGRAPMPLRECINDLTHSLLQQGLNMRQREYGAPPSARKDITTSSSGEGRSIRSDLNRQPFETPPGPHGTGALHTGTSRTPVSNITPRAPYYQQVASETLKRKQPGRSHQPLQAMIVNSSVRDCRYKKCLGFDKPRKETKILSNKISM
jgi:hypothetical protein